VRFLQIKNVHANHAIFLEYTFLRCADNGWSPPKPERVNLKHSRMQLTHDEITRLSPDERLVLIAQLWDSLDDHQVRLMPAS
jgi:hypothetical protein